MSTTAFYDWLAASYHLCYDDWSESVRRQGEALTSLLSAHGVPPGSEVLDAACGVGTQSLGLAAAGYRVTGSDLSAGAIARARDEAAGRRLEIGFSVADLRTLAGHHRRTFDAVIACDNAIPHLRSEQEVELALQQMRLCTLPGGVCLISVRDYEREDFSRAVQARQPLVHEKDGVRHIVFQVWTTRQGSYDLSLYVIEHAHAQPPRVEVMRSRYYPVAIDTLIRLMQRAGLVEIERIDDAFFQPVLLGRRPDRDVGPASDARP